MRLPFSKLPPMKPYIFSPLFAIFFAVLAVFAIFGCSDDADELPCLTCGTTSKCGDGWYDASTQFCYGTMAVYSKCGGSSYTPSTQFCSENEVYNKCNGSEYYPLTKFCYGNTLYDKCGSYEYTPSTQFCYGNTVYNKCGTLTFTPGTEQCCGSSKYTTSTQFCSGNTVYDKCGGKIEFTPSIEQCCGSSKYTISTQRCGSGNVIETKCGTGWYDATNTNLRCQSNVIETKCGTNGWYNSSTQYCSDGTVKTYDGSVTYDSKTYNAVLIGTQTWMAENLNYNAANSRCYGDNSGGDSQGNCAKYGRLYNWATAMALDASCNTSSCASQITTPHQGICPTGWHIPNDDEWSALMNSVGGSSIAGRKLKSTEGWSNCGNGSSYSYQCEDTYGFSALPGGYGSSDGGFYGVGSYGYWWSASGSLSNYAYLRYMYYDGELAYYDFNSKSILFSVRCVQD